MKIVLYVNSFLPSIGGREIVVHYLAREYSRLGHDVRVLGPSGWIKHRKMAFEYPVHRWPTLRGLFKEQVQYAQLLMDIALWGCDVIHAHSTYPSGFAAARLKKRRRLPLVITPHGEDIHVVPEIGFGLRLNPLLQTKIEESIKVAEILTAISNSVEKSLIDAGCPKEKIIKIENGIDIDRFKRNQDVDMRSRLGIGKDSGLILSVGNFHKRKGHENLLRAMREILKQLPNTHLVIVGRGTEQLQFLVDELNLKENIHLLGAISFPLIKIKNPKSCHEKEKDLLAALYSTSNVYVSAAINDGAEGLSLSLLDAMAAGLPVVATRISGNVDVVENNKNGLIVQESDPKQISEALVKILKNKENAKKMGKVGLEKIVKYDWRSIAEKYIKVYKMAINSIKE